jgi:putative Mg2+ transporter-C (MgtC) family protein
MVAAGSAIFAMISLVVPYVAGVSEEAIRNTLPDRVLANIVVGVGFLGAGIIVKEGLHVRGLTTAATVWFVAAIGTLAGIGLLQFAAVSAVGLSLLLYFLRKIDLYAILKRLGKKEEREELGDEEK